jgi:hypothetical protein
MGPKCAFCHATFRLPVVYPSGVGSGIYELRAQCRGQDRNTISDADQLSHVMLEEVIEGGSADMKGRSCSTKLWSSPTFKGERLNKGTKQVNKHNNNQKSNHTPTATAKPEE